MKNLSCIFLCLLFSFSLYSQSWFSENQKWSYSSAIYGWIIGIEQVQITGETTFDGRDCFVFSQFIEGVEFMSTEVQSTTIDIYAYEENDVVYAHFNGSWQAIYDFNMEVGDTLFYTALECEESKFYTVLDVGMVDIDGQELRTQTIWVNGEYSPAIIVEKLGYFRSEGEQEGSYYGGYLFIHEVFGCLYDYYPDRDFNCYKDNLINYNPDDENCSFIISSTIEPATFGTVRLSPNPTTDYLHLAIDQIDQVNELRILSTNGQLMWKSQEINEKIDVQSFSSGIYFIQLMDQQGNQSIFRWLKKE